MDFKQATDALFKSVTHEELADTLGVSVALIRQARLNPSAKSFRTAPKDWKSAVGRIADERARQYSQLSEQLRGATADRG